MLPPLPTGQLFQIHGSKLKIHPVCYLDQASVLCITHSVFFFCVRKDAFNRLFPLVVKVPVLRCIADVVRQILVILPDLPLYGLYAALGMRAAFSGGTIRANPGITLVFPVAVPVCGGILEDLVFRANHAVISDRIRRPWRWASVSAFCHEYGLLCEWEEVFRKQGGLLSI